MPKDTLLQTLPDKCTFFLEFHQDKTSASSTFWVDEFSSAKYELISVSVSWSSKSSCPLSWVFTTVSGRKAEKNDKKL